MSLDNWTRIVWPWEPELGVKDIFGGIPTLPSLSDFSVDIYLYIDGWIDKLMDTYMKR